jgi:hypothetical protein
MPQALCTAGLAGTCSRRSGRASSPYLTLRLETAQRHTGDRLGRPTAVAGHVIELAAASEKGPLDVEDLEHLAIVAYLIGEDDESAQA